MAISLRQLQIFAKVAALESVTRASAELQLTQSAVSMALAELERYSDAPLFNRHGKRLHLNDRGRQFLPMVKQLLTQQLEIEMFLNQSLREPIGILQVGASTTIGNYLMPGLIARFCRQHSKAKILLQVANAWQIEQDVESGKLDIGLIEGFLHTAGLHTRKWRDDELIIVTGPQHPWVETGVIGDDQLQHGEWVVREKGSGTREVFERAMLKRQLAFAVTIELGHTEAIKKAVEAGTGCACLSRLAVQRELDHGWLVEIDSPLDLSRDLSILAKESVHQSVLLRTFLESLREAD